MHNATYHVYYAPDGCDDCYVGEAASLDEARALMESGQKGLERSLWDTARAAGHCAGLVAPETEHEDDEPLEWGGPEGYHCIVAVRDPA